MADKKDSVVLEIEGTPVECKKDLLIKNSDYFSAMFRGNFKESSQETIKIQGVDLKSFNSILLLLWDESYIIEDGEIHCILQAACMLQFNTIIQLCESRILDILNPSICLKIWKTTELLNISPLWLKAKCMALEDFSSICDNSHILELNLDDICSYLGHTYLNVKSELTVFQTAMNWWYENQELYNKEESTKIILRLLNCVDFNKLTEIDIKEMQSYPDVANNVDIISVLNCLVEFKAKGTRVGSNFSEEQIMYAKHLSNSKSRKKPDIPCLLLQKEHSNTQIPHKKIKCSEVEEKHVVIYDKFLRKRNLHNISECSPQEVDSFNIICSAIINDGSSTHLRNFFQIPGDKLMNLVGFKLFSYKEFVFLYGGEYLIGAGQWNCNFWSYDTFKEKWERKTILPQGRRHFETIMVDHCVYIIGGVGKFRVIQEKILWYDFKADEWSSTIPLPMEERNCKCCSFKGQLFIIYLTERRAYFFNKELTSWRRITIMIEKEVVDEMGDFAVFSDMDYLYIKGKHLIKCELSTNMLNEENLIPVSQRTMKDVEYEGIESVLCNNIIYTLYRCYNEQYALSYTFESFNLETAKLHYIFKNKVEIDTLDGTLFCSTMYTKLFSFRYFYLVKENICVNCPII